MGILGLFKPKEVDLQNEGNKEIVVAVPDIKEHLVREYERVNKLLLNNEILERKLEEAREIALKYDAALVTLDEYSKRLSAAEQRIADQKALTEAERRRTRAVNDELNSYKIKLNDAALTKEEMKVEIVEQTKIDIIDRIKAQKGALSKKTICDIVENYRG